MARGPQSITQPVGSVTIAPGTNTIQTAVAANPAGTSFWLTAGTHSLTSAVTPKTGNTFTGQLGAIVDGSGWAFTGDLNQGAFRAQNQVINNVTLRNLVIQHMPMRAVHCYNGPDNWLIENCDLNDNRNAIRVWSNSTVQRCHILRNTGDDTNPNVNLQGGGYGCYQATGCLFNDNEIANNGPEQKFFESTNNSFTGNYFHDGDKGIWFDGCSGCTATGNTIEDLRIGLEFEISRTATINSNTIRRCTHSAIFVSCSFGGDIYGNILEDNLRGIQYFVDILRAGTITGLGFAHDLRDNSSHHNTTRIPVSASNTGGGSLVLTNASAAQITTYQTAKNLTFTANAYTAPTITASYWNWGGTPKTWTTWRAIPQDATGTLALITPPALLTADRITYLSSMSIGTVPTGGGDLAYGAGFAARRVNGQLRLYLGSYNPATILEYQAPASLSGVTTYIRNLGTLPAASGAMVGGLLWDGSYLYQSAHGTYDAESRIDRTLSRGTINETTGKLEWVTDPTGARDFWLFENRSDKMTQGGVTHIPGWFSAAYLPIGYRLAAGFGGYRSVVTTGPASMGPALTAFAPPATMTSGTPIPNRPLQSYPFGTSVTGTPRQQRATNYVNEFTDGFPTTPTTTGYWTWADQIWGGGAWVDTGNYSGMVYLATMGTGCCFYGHNDGSLSPCANTAGTPASINSSATEQCWLIANPVHLAAVAAGANPASIQCAFTRTQFPGVTNTAGVQSIFSICTGMAWLPDENLLLAAMRFPTGGGRPIILAFRITGGVVPPVPLPLSITTSSLPTGLIFAQYAGVTLQATGGTQPYVFTTTTTLPTGMTLSSAGVLAGTPTQAGTFAVGLRVTDAQPVQSNKTLSLLITAPTPPALVIDTTTYGTTEEDRPFSATAHAHGGAPPYVWTFGTLPTGLSANATTGVISGTPTTPGNYTIGTSVTDSQPVTTGPTSVPLVVTAAPVVPTLTLTTTNFGSTEEDKAFSVTAHATGGVVPYVWTFTALPTGLTGNSTTGVISGIPTTPGTYGVMVTVTDARPVAVGPTSVPLIVTATPTPLTVTTLALTSGQINVVYPGATLAATGGTLPYSWSQTGGPTGLTLSSAGVYSGTPTQSGSFTVAATVTDVLSKTGNRNLPLTIAAAPAALVITTSSLVSGQIHVVYAGAQMAATGGVAPYTWSQTGGPTGLTMSSGGSYTGTPTQSGSFTVAVTVTDAQPVSTPRNLLLSIAPAPTPFPVITTTSLPDGTVGLLYQQTLAATSTATPLTWACTNTPGGLALSTTGVLSGTPTTAATTNLAIAVRDTLNQITQGTIPLTVAAAPIPAPVITTTSLPDATVGTPYQATLTATGGVDPLRWSASNLPAGLALSTGGILTGQATTPDVIDLAVTVTDAQPLSTPGLIPFTILRADPPVISDLVVTTTTLAVATMGTAYSQQLTAAGGTAPYLWACDNLPGDFVLNSSGLLQGTPVVATILDLTIGVSDSQSPSDTAGVVLTLTVLGPAPDPGEGPPLIPLLYLPRNKARKVTNVTTNGSVIRWFSGDTTDAYQVYHGTTPNPPVIGTVYAGDAAYEEDYPGGSLFFPVTRVAGETYYWKIVAVNGAGVTPSALWKYTVKPAGR